MRDKKIWIFNAGNSFEGNPKWLFLYITKYRKDITPYWFCYDNKLKNYIRKLGYKAYLFTSKKAEQIGLLAGVYVVNQKKEIFQEYFDGITILNLWHGVGCKTVEKGVCGGFLNERIVKKTIRYTNVYKRFQIFLVTSPLMEKHFMEQCDVDADKVIRAGYPCCFYSDDEVKTFNHDFLQSKGLPDDTKIAVYAPTYRDYQEKGFFSLAIPDMDRLVQTLEENNYLLIFKMHPKMVNDFEYNNILNRYKNHPRLLFWDNLNDFYEIMNQIDLAIVDYSSIFYDMLARGVKHFVRYIFDYENGESVRDFAFNYKEMTCGKICNDFDQLLQVFSEKIGTDENELHRIYNLFWSYEQGDSCRKIIEQALSFTPDTSNTLPTLYSFDVFDTLIGRTTLLPEGVFKYVKHKLMSSELGYSDYVIQHFDKIRRWSEQNCREYYKKSQLSRNTDKIEITFDMIYDHMKKVYDMSEEQIEQLKKWELECEYLTSIPCEENIQLVKELLSTGETVVLISDMYLPKAFVQKLLKKADPVLGTLPLFLSSEYGVQKTTKKLFLEVFREVDYQFGAWVHYGDNAKADGSVPNSLGIQTINHRVPQLNHYEKEMNSFIGSYDAYQISGICARFRSEKHTSAEIFAYCYASLYWVPYVDWAIRHAMRQGIQCLYFISRDGHYLKRIADVLIQKNKWAIRTKYIYGSRKAWRIPSQIDNIDDAFFGNYGNFVDIKDYEQLLAAADISDEQFCEILPELAFLRSQKRISPKQLESIRITLKNSSKYHALVLAKAKDERKIILDYLKQEIDFNEKYAFVEYWGRGYTQTCLAKLIWEAQGRISDNIFYYARSIYPSEDHLVRYNFSTNSYSYIFIEALFANVPYKSIATYRREQGSIVPEIIPCENYRELHEAFEKFLPLFAADFTNLSLQNREVITRSLFDFGLSYYHRFQQRNIFRENISNLSDSVAMHGKIKKYAPPITIVSIIKHFSGERFQTSSKRMSLQNSWWGYRKLYNFYCRVVKPSKIGAILIKRIQGK